MDIGTMVLRLLAALVLGGIAGWQRQKESKPAGLRTHMLVCVGSTVFVMLAQEVAMTTSQSEMLPRDSLRVLAAVVTGVGFLGAGTIIQGRGRVEGLTTAAGLWVMAGVGAALGFGSYVMATVTTLLVWAVLQVLGALEPKASRSGGDQIEH